MRKRLLIGFLGMCLCISLVGCGSVQSSTPQVATYLADATLTPRNNESTTKSTEKATQKTTEAATSALDAIKKYTPGQYKVGKDIPAGEYIVIAIDSIGGYFCLSSDANGNNIIANENFDVNSIITVNDGEYLKLSRSSACLSSDYYGAGYVIKSSLSGVMLKVGYDIKAGEYKLSSTDSIGGYYCIYNSSRQQDIIANDNFDSSCYVNVSDGQYLVLSRCKISE